MTILFILIGVCVISFIKNLICAAFGSTVEKISPKWNGQLIRNPITNKVRKVYSYSGKIKETNFAHRIISPGHRRYLPKKHSKNLFK